MNVVTLSTNVQSVEQKTYTRQDGTQGQLTVIKFPWKDRQKVDGKWKTVNIAWCQATAYDKQAENWARLFVKDNAIEVTGRLYKVEQWAKKNGNGEVGITHIFQGVDGGTPAISFPPRDYAEQGEEGGNGGGYDQAEPPF